MILTHPAVGYMCIGVMNASSTIMIDLVPGQGSAITACVSISYYTPSILTKRDQNNLVRCLLSAALVSVIQLIFDGIGVGWTYILLTGLTLLSLPVTYLELKIGPRIRRKRFNALTIPN